MEFTQKEINELFGLLKIELSKKDLSALITACNENISFRCNHDEILADETTIDTLIRFSQKEFLIPKIKSIRPDLSLNINKMINNI